MTTETENQDGSNGAPPTKAAPVKKKPAPKKKTMSATELKRQIAELKANLRDSNEENQLLNELVTTQQETISSSGVRPGEIIADVSILGERWDKVLGEVAAGEPLYYLDGDAEASAGFIARIPQDEDDVLYQIKVGTKVAYMGDIEDAGIQGEAWSDGANVTSYRAKDNPVNIDTYLDANQSRLPQGNTREMKSTGEARDSLDPNIHVEVETAFQMVGSPEKAAMLAFMEMELDVYLHDSTNPVDIPIPCFINDGRTQYFIRGQKQTVKRKFVEILGRCKKTVFTNEMYKDAAGADAYRYNPHTALMYPFSVTGDPHPRGQDWLNGVLSEN